MLVLPKLLPDENLYSLIARISHLNGLRHAEIARMLLGNANSVTIIGCEVNIRHFSEVTNGLYGSPKEIIENLTVMPLLSHLGEPSVAKLKEAAVGEVRPMLSTLVFGRNRGFHWKVCSECRAHDLKTYGIAYWHRTHQIPCNLYCVEHKQLLERLKIKHVLLHNHLYLPYELAEDVTKIGFEESVQGDNICLALSQMAVDAISKSIEPNSVLAIHTAFKLRLIQKGLLTQKQKLLRIKLIEEFNEAFASDESLAALMSQLNVKHPSQFLLGITNEYASRPFARLILVYWLFKTWAAFTEACQWQEVFCTNADNERDKAFQHSEKISNPSENIALKQYRQKCLDYKRSHEMPTRLEFLKTAYRAFHWLLHNDRDWLDSELPMLPTGKGQQDLFD